MVVSIKLVGSMGVVKVAIHMRLVYSGIINFVSRTVHALPVVHVALSMKERNYNVRHPAPRVDVAIARLESTKARLARVPASAAM
jgi:hypothetical protein